MTRRIYTLLSIFVSIFLLNSCFRDNLIEPQEFFAGDGKTVTVSLGINSQEMSILTKAAMSEERERYIEDIYVLAFRLDSDSDSNPKVANRDDNRYFSREDISRVDPENDIHYNAGSVCLYDIPTGTYYIAAVANVMYGDIDSQSLKDQLDSVTDFESFQAVTVNLKDKANLNRTYLSMSGYYLEEGTSEEETHYDPEIAHGGIGPQKVRINRGGYLGGYVHLRRLDAQIHFTILNNMQNATKFRIKSWKFVNIPDQAAVIEDAEDRCSEYSETEQIISGWTKVEGFGELMTKYDLDVYMMENRGLSKNAISSYKLRELEEKQAPLPDGSTPNYEVPRYINAPSNSTYLLFDAEFQQTMTEDGQEYMRDVTSQYIVHLGYCEEATVDGVTSKANDFNNRRNTKYFYTVKINGADEIVVEAQKQPVEYNHGVEGTVVDVKGGQVIDLDAHYNVFNVMLSRKDIRDMHLYIKSPLGEWSTVGTDPSDPSYPHYLTEDYQHIRIAYNESGTQQFNAASGTYTQKCDAVTKLVSYSDTYDYDCPLGTDISAIVDQTLIPGHNEKKQIQDATHICPVYDIHSFKKEYGREYDPSTNPNGYTDANLDDILVFTVYVNEFYYYHTNGKISDRERFDSDGFVISGTETPLDLKMWSHFVNRLDGRTFMFLTTSGEGGVSQDLDSKYITCKVKIFQRSIETYFGDHILDGHNQSDPDFPSALGIEQINEHHYKNLALNIPTAYKSKFVSPRSDGWKNTSNVVKGDRWDQHVDQNHIMGAFYRGGTGSSDPDGFDYRYNVFRSKSSKEIDPSAANINYKYFNSPMQDAYNYNLVDAAMSRNRDLNRDGIITIDEVRWFAPSSDQYVTFAVGAGALQTKLFERTDFQDGTAYWNYTNRNSHISQVYSNGAFYYAGIDGKYLVSGEGTSTGNSETGGENFNIFGTQAAGEIRCCRYLGVPGGDSGYDHITLPQPASFDPATRVINTTNYDLKMHRANVAGALPVHDNFSGGSTGYNSLPHYFQMAKRNGFHTVHNYVEAIKPENGGTNDPEANFLNMIDKNYFCHDYYENEDGSDRGTWRMPNMVEVALMCTYGGLSAGTMDPTDQANPGILSCTYWYRNQDVANMGSTSFEGETQSRSGRMLWRHFLGAKKEGSYVLLTMIHTRRLFNDSYWYNTRCVRDTDKDGNYTASPEYENPLDFESLDLQCTYNEDGTANLSVDWGMNSFGSVQSVTIDGNPATTSSSYTSTVNHAEVRSSEVSVVWNLMYNGKLLNYRRTYSLPARYWMISRYGVANRYAAVNPDNNRTYVGAADTRDVNSMEAIYKWILTKSNGTPVNESELNTSDTYYLYNAGVEAYISDVATSRSYMGAGGNAVPVRLLTRAGYDGYYVLRLNNNTHANSNGGVDCFGTWNGGPDDGCTYKLTPAVLRGELPFRFTPGEFSTEYDTEDGTRATFTFDASFESATSELVSVSINGVAVQDPAVTGDDIHCEVGNSLIPENGLAEVRWTFTKHGETIVKSQTYELPVKFYLIKSILSSDSWGYPYVYVDTDGNTRANPYAVDVDKSRIPMKYRWVLSGDTASPTGNIPASELVVNANRSLYLYNLEAQGYIAKPDPVNNNADYLPTGPVPHRFCFDASRNGGFRPYFKWDGTNTYGSCANASRNHVKEKFGFSPAGVDGAYWIFVPVYLDHGAAHE